MELYEEIWFLQSEIVSYIYTIIPNQICISNTRWLTQMSTKKSSYPSLTIIVLKCLCTPDGVTLLLIIFGYMNKSVLTALVVMPAIAASSLVGVTFANSNSVDTSSVKNGFQKQIQGGLNHLKWDHRMNGGMIHGMQNLTDDEKKSLESMTDTQKKEFFQKKMDEQKAKMDARDAVLDKLLNGESLSDADKVIVTEIKAERVKMRLSQQKNRHFSMLIGQKVIAMNIVEKWWNKLDKQVLCNKKTTV